MVFKDNRIFNRAVEKMKAAGEKEIYFYTIPTGFKNNKELLEYWYERGYQAEIVDIGQQAVRVLLLPEHFYTTAN